MTVRPQCRNLVAVRIDEHGVDWREGRGGDLDEKPQDEVDLVLVAGRTRVLVEVKAGLSVNERDVMRLKRCADQLDASRSYVMTFGDQRHPLA